MKIYANQIRCNYTVFDPFVGLDVWVRCYLAGGSFTEIGYARFLNKETSSSGTYFNLNFISERDLASDSLFNAKGKNFISLSTQTVSEVQVTLVSPVTTRTTKELLPEYQSIDHNLFADFVGTNMWVKVKKRYNPYRYYIKVLSCDDLTMSINVVDDVLIDCAVDEIGEYMKCPSKYIKHEIVYIETFEICQPLTVLGQDDIDDLLAYADTVWERLQEDG